MCARFSKTSAATVTAPRIRARLARSSRHICADFRIGNICRRLRRLCGACTETCPVKIDLHHHLLHNRRNAVAPRPARLEKLLQAGFVFMMCRPGLYELAARLGRIVQPLHRLVRGTILDPLRAWTKTRSFPPLAEKSFRELWRERKKP